jgi:hypothetical protein
MCASCSQSADKGVVHCRHIILAETLTFFAICVDSFLFFPGLNTVVILHKVLSVRVKDCYFISVLCFIKRATLV